MRLKDNYIILSELMEKRKIKCDISHIIFLEELKKSAKTGG
jgi:hypothetical protein